MTVMMTADEFARMKALGIRLMALERAARDQLNHAIVHEYEAAQISAMPFRGRQIARWKNRGARRATRGLLTSLMLSVANLETLMRGWEDSRRDFEEVSADGAQHLLFATDCKRDIANIQSLKLDHLETAVEQLGDSLNNTAMVSATIVGALAGGVAGGVLGAVAAIAGG
jgi:hypothetical protein